MGNLLSGLGLGGEDNSFIWIIILVVILLFSGNNTCGNPCDNSGEQQNDWIWILVVIAILFLCNGNNGLFGGNCDCKKPC
jgi:hypothetical protein